ncbi:MAG: hypothetical protein QOJ99_2690 [Bryobacterales bacterium]|nr:hypothetical protein [Bryobacterales bacterium]
MSMGLDHDAIIRSQTPEKYVLGELLPHEREEFEEHVADCTICMQDLAAADMFAANASAVFADEAAALANKSAKAAGEKSGSWFDFLRPRAFPVLAFSGVLNLALLVFVGYGVTRMATVPELRPEVAEAFTVRPPARSGPGQVCAVGRSRSFATLQFDLSRPYQRYSYSLDGAGQSPVNAARASGSETLNLTVLVSGLKPGDHKFELSGWDGQRNVEIGECILRVEPGK